MDTQNKGPQHLVRVMPHATYCCTYVRMPSRRHNQNLPRLAAVLLLHNQHHAKAQARAAECVCSDGIPIPPGCYSSTTTYTRLSSTAMYDCNDLVRTLHTAHATGEGGSDASAIISNTTNTTNTVSGSNHHHRIADRSIACRKTSKYTAPAAPLQPCDL